MAKAVQKKPAKKASASVMKRSDAMDSEHPAALSTLDFYINRGGKKITAPRRARLEKTKQELRKVFHHE